MRRTAIFDIDGTVFRSSLLIRLTEALVHEGVFGEAARKTYAPAHRRWADRRGPYEDYILAVIRAFERNIAGVSHRDVIRIAKKEVAYQKNRVYRYTRDLLKDLKKKKYYLLAISNSPREIVYAFCKELGFDKVYARVYEVDARGKFTGRLLYGDLISDKAKILKRAAEKEGLTLKGSIGVGDSESDIPFLKLVGKPVCFNPNKKLYSAARRRGWAVVVERKDVVYDI